MTEQLTLIDAPPAPKLTDRQQFALQFVTANRTDGVTADEVGAAWCEQKGKHSADDRCQFDGQSGTEVLKALRTKGLVKYRRRTRLLEGAWLAVGASEPRTVEVPYDVFPEGF